MTETEIRPFIWHTDRVLEMEKIRVTVVIPAYNAAAYLAETLKSIVGQTYSNLEVIVVDDGSTDDTARIAASFGDRVSYLYQKNSGSCAAPRNTGLQAASGELISFCDADDTMVPDKIERQVESLREHPGAAMCISNYRNFTATEQGNDHFASCPRLMEILHKQPLSLAVLGSRECREILLHENFSIASSPLFRTKVVRELRGFDESLKACEDFHLIYRAAAQGPVVIDPQVSFNRRLHDLNMSGDDERMLRNYIRCRTMLSQMETSEPLRQLLEDRVRRATRSLQDCLVRKGKSAEPINLYLQTFPPKSLGEFKADCKQATKLILNRLGLIKPKPES